VGTGGGTRHHHEACVEQSHEKPVAIGCLGLKLDRNARRVKWFSKALFGVCNNSINKMMAPPNHPISPVASLYVS
jgi:hypothetical protein